MVCIYTSAEGHFCSDFAISVIEEGACRTLRLTLPNDGIKVLDGMLDDRARVGSIEACQRVVTLWDGHVAVLATWVGCGGSNLLDVLVADNIFLFSLDEKDWKGELLHGLLGHLLLLDPDGGCRGGEVVDGLVMGEDLVPLGPVFWVHALELTHKDVIRLHCFKNSDNLVQIVELLSPKMVVRSNQTHARKHSLSNSLCSHVGRNKTTKRTT